MKKNGWMKYALIAAGVGVGAYLLLPQFRKMINPNAAYAYPAFDQAGAEAAASTAIQAIHADCRAKHDVLKAAYHAELNSGRPAKAAIHNYVAANIALNKECQARHRAAILQIRAQFMSARPVHP